MIQEMKVSSANDYHYYLCVQLIIITIMYYNNTHILYICIYMCNMVYFNVF